MTARGEPARGDAGAPYNLVAEQAAALQFQLSEVERLKNELAAAAAEADRLAALLTEWLKWYGWHWNLPKGLATETDAALSARAALGRAET